MPMIAPVRRSLPERHFSGSVSSPAMMRIGVGFRWLGGALRAGLADPESQAIVLLLAILLAIATAFYMVVEGWTFVDSLHYGVMLVTTIGDTSRTPTSTGSKLFTVVYAVVGVGLLLVFVSRVATLMIRHRDK